jgi:hypothetical protein
MESILQSAAAADAASLPITPDHNPRDNDNGDGFRPKEAGEDPPRQRNHNAVGGGEGRRRKYETAMVHWLLRLAHRDIPRQGHAPATAEIKAGYHVLPRR